MVQNVRIDSDGAAIFTVDNRLHSSERPSVVYPNNTEYWYWNDVPHREDGPAVTFYNGTRYWMQNGSIHNLNGPAVVCHDGREFYYIEGKELTRDAYYSRISLMVESISDHD